MKRSLLGALALLLALGGIVHAQLAPGVIGGGGGAGGGTGCNTSGTALLKGNGTGGCSNAVAGTDYLSTGSIGGDCTFTPPSTFTCTKSNGSPLAAIAISGSASDLTTGTVNLALLPFTLPLSVANGGSGSATPGLVAGTNVTITGTWPNQTIAAAGGGGGSGTVASSTIGQLSAYTGATTVTGITLGGDCSFSSPNLTCTKTGGTPFAAIATSGSASDLTTGTLAAARMPLGLTAAPAAGTIPVGNAGGTAYAATAISGDSTLTSAGVMANTRLHFGANVLNLPATAPTSGGIPYFSSTSALASSAALTANAPVIGGGAGVAPSSGSRSGNTTTFATTSGSLPSGDLAKFDASGNVIDGVSLPLSVANGGSGTATPGLVAGTNVTITGSWPNQTVNSTVSAVNYANLNTTRVTSLTPTCSATSGTNPSLDVYTYTLTGATTVTTPTGCISGDKIDLKFIQADNSSFQVSLVDGIAQTHTGTLDAMPTSTTIAQAYFVHAILEYQAAQSQWEIVEQNTNPVTPLGVAGGGTGTATPALVAGTNVTITGSWPNQTINSSAGGSGYPAGAPAQIGGFSATNTAEAETLSGDCSLTRAGANSYTITCPKTGGTSFAAIATSGSASDLTTGTLAAARLPNPSATTLGGVESIATASHQFLTGISTSGVPSKAQPAAADISGLAAVATSGSASDLGTGTLNNAQLPASISQANLTATSLANSNAQAFGAAANPTLNGAVTVTIGNQYEYDPTLTGAGTINLAIAGGLPSNVVIPLFMRVCMDAVGAHALTINGPGGGTVLNWQADGGTMPQPSQGANQCSLYQLTYRSAANTITEDIKMLAATPTALAAVEACAANQVLDATSGTGGGVNDCEQLAFSNLSGAATLAQLPTLWIDTGGNLANAAAATGVGLRLLTPTAMHLINFTAAITAPAASCTTYPVWVVEDCGTGAPSQTGVCTGGTQLSSLTDGANGAALDSGAISVAVASGHYVEVYSTTAASGCTITGVNFNEMWTIP